MDNVDIHSDPLVVRNSTRRVMESALSVSINKAGLSVFASAIRERFSAGLDSPADAFAAKGDLSTDLQLVFVEDVVNFSFWAGKDEPLWQIQDDTGGLTTGGWYGLRACFDRGLRAGVPILDAHYLANLSSESANMFFEGEGGVPIPLLAERVHNLQEAGRLLVENFDGSFINLFEAAEGDACTLSRLVITHFPSFRDVSMLDREEVFFYKRAQILSQDVQYILEHAGKTLTNLPLLTAFADYKLPQMLRFFGCIAYESGLAERIDNFIPIPHDSREEIEVRSATVQAVECLREYLPEMTAAQIDNTIWAMSQSAQGEAQPYHRTRTIFY